MAANANDPTRILKFSAAARTAYCRTAYCRTDLAVWLWYSRPAIASTARGPARREDRLQARQLVRRVRLPPPALVSFHVNTMLASPCPYSTPTDAWSGVLGGRPKDATGWRAVVDGAFSAFMQTAPKLKISEEAYHHRRAQTPFAAVACGVSHGGGQLEPGILKQTKTASATNSRLVAGPAPQAEQDPSPSDARPAQRQALQTHRRLYSRHVCVFRTWAPRLYGYYADTRDRLFQWKPSLRAGWPFEEDDGVFAAATFNFGRAVSCCHLDFGNLAWGWCAITALGEFDPDLGGHLILWELGLVIRFPPGLVDSHTLRRHPPLQHPHSTPRAPLLYLIVQSASSNPAHDVRRDFDALHDRLEKEQRAFSVPVRASMRLCSRSHSAGTPNKSLGVRYRINDTREIYVHITGASGLDSHASRQNEPWLRPPDVPLHALEIGSVVFIVAHLFRIQHIHPETTALDSARKATGAHASA
ncbi:hypothetical protein HMN09_00118700 [Mycena chlorophos]|uniref:Uncharacterized protein n=1 Tax=Mycena chlorophos TaxID=658473 RepID=A0A8H6TSW9_MYCCL|nr:hypothetical protein HMN09_00118700 [Mycena chlorophos]